MRRIPKKAATREDIYNIAMDLPPERVSPWLESVTDEDLRRVGMSREDFFIMRCRVANARQLLLELRKSLSMKIAWLGVDIERLAALTTPEGMATAHREIDAIGTRLREVLRNVK